MAACPAEFSPLLECDVNAAWQTIGTATVDGKARETAWTNWSNHACLCQIDPWMRCFNKALRQTHFVAFAARVRTGIFGRAKPVGSQQVEKVMRHVAQTLMLVGCNDPHRTCGSKELDLPFRHLLKIHKEQDPAPKPQLTLLVKTIEQARARCQATQPARTQATAELVIIAFFFLLRVGECTMPNATKSTRTVQLRVKDAFFQKHGLSLPNTAPFLQLSQANSVTLHLDNQKNGQRGATICHTACQG